MTWLPEYKLHKHYAFYSLQLEPYGPLVMFRFCTCCEQLMPTEYFNRNAKGAKGINAQCRECQAKKRRKWAATRSPEYRAADNANYKARKRHLPAGLTESDIILIRDRFDNACALTGKRDNLTYDHALPLQRGGASVIGNIIPLDSMLNMSKQKQNLFKWFSENKERLELDQERFDSLVTYLAEMNHMTVDGYRTFYESYFTEESGMVRTG